MKQFFSPAVGDSLCLCPLAIWLWWKSWGKDSFKLSHLSTHMNLFHQIWESLGHFSSNILPFFLSPLLLGLLLYTVCLTVLHGPLGICMFLVLLSFCSSGSIFPTDLSSNSLILFYQLKFAVEPSYWILHIFWFILSGTSIHLFIYKISMFLSLFYF
jgi:hypothetical protein